MENVEVLIRRGQDPIFYHRIGFLEVAKLGPNDTFYETGFNTVVEYVVHKAPEISTSEDTGRQLKWVGRHVETRKLVSFLISEEYAHYGPKILIQDDVSAQALENWKREWQRK